MSHNSPHPLNMCVRVFHEDSRDEISCDSLGLSPHEEDSSDEDAQMHSRITGERSRDEEQGNPATSHLGDSFVPVDAEQEDLLTDEPEQLSETSMVTFSHVPTCLLWFGEGIIGLRARIELFSEESNFLLLDKRHGFTGFKYKYYKISLNNISPHSSTSNLVDLEVFKCKCPLQPGKYWIEMTAWSLSISVTKVIFSYTTRVCEYSKTHRHHFDNK